MLFAATLILTLAAIAVLRPAVRRRAIVLLLPAFVTAALACRFYSAKAAGSASFGRIQGYGSRIGLRAERRRSWIS